MGHDNITKLASLLVKLHRAPSSWLCLHPRPDRTNGVNNQRQIKLVRSDGSLQVYDRPVVVSELTKDFPKHKICRSDLLYIGQKTPVLSETDTLKLGLNYFLLPSDFFKNDLSFLTISTLKTPQNGGVLVKKSHKQSQPFLIQKGEKGERLKIRVSEDFMSELMMEGRKNRAKEEEEEEEEDKEGRVCTTVKLKKEYVQLVGLRKWKPKLETITETKAMKAATVEKTKKKRKRFTAMKKKKSQTDSNSKRKFHSRFKSKTKRPVFRKSE